MREVTGLADLRRPIMGDLLRVALYAARMHPDQDVRDAVLLACDVALDNMGAPGRTELHVRAALKAAKGPSIAPMLATDADIAITTRVWRACAAAGTASIFVGSADAVGEGYGASLGPDKKAIYRSRDSRLTARGSRRAPEAEGIAINLGLLPAVDRLVPIDAAHSASLRVDSEHGIRISVSALTSPRMGLSMSMGSWIAERTRSRPAAEALLTLDRMGLSVNLTDDKSIEIVARTPEAAIRLASACSSRSLLCLCRPESDHALDPAVLILLEPTDRAPASLAAELHSFSGPLADWLRIPPLPLVPELNKSVRTAIESWVAESVHWS